MLNSSVADSGKSFPKADCMVITSYQRLAFRILLIA